ncbi:hypothetical protein Pelo_8275 [Pelomyxa schiedti]|nr:hypothetical protein Pelo_8275 [Pelomyxa schiedti]
MMNSRRCVRPEVVGALCDILTPYVCCEYIFRLSGVRERADKMVYAIQSTTTSDQAAVTKAIRAALGDAVEPHDVTSAFKQYLRGLDQPIIPPANAQAFKDALEQSRKGDTAELASAVASLPPGNRVALQVLMRLLFQVSEESKSNLMDARSIGVLVGPSLFREDPSTAAVGVRQHSEIITALIEHFPDIFESNSAEWAEFVDPATGKTFYSNKIGNYTQWDVPKVLRPKVTSPPPKTVHTEEQTLPTGWTSITDTEGRLLYVNTETGQTQWTKPTMSTIQSHRSSAPPQKPLPKPGGAPTPPPKTGTTPTPPPKRLPTPPPKTLPNAGPSSPTLSPAEPARTDSPPPPPPQQSTTPPISPVILPHPETVRAVSPPPRSTTPPASAPSQHHHHHEHHVKKPSTSKSTKEVQPATTPAATELPATQQPTTVAPPVAEEPPKTVKISGWMFKDGGGRMKGWQRRWFDLDPDRKTLTYSKTSGSTTPKGVITLDQASVTNEIAPGKEFSFTLRTPGRDFHLQASSMPDQQAWMHALRCALPKS